MDALDIMTNTAAQDVLTRQETISEQPTRLQQDIPTSKLFHTHAIDWCIVAGLVFSALVPRILLARQLDLVTDETIYIIAAKMYLPLLLHLKFMAGGWNYNYEHPPFVKMLIALSLFINSHIGHPASDLNAARIPSIISGTLLVVAIYWLGRMASGRGVALLAALCLAFSPWLVYFSALAYLDMTMTALITIAYLLLWPAIRQPRLYLLVGALVGMGVASKYTAALAIPAIILFTGYYYFILPLRLPRQRRPHIPWLWWIAATVLAAVTFFVADPAIWRNPASLLVRSFLFEWHQSVDGHLTFLAGQHSDHIPHWTILYVIFAKISVFVTIPAAFFVIYALIQLIRFHSGKSHVPGAEIASKAFLSFWLLSMLGMFSLLNIAVGTHYYLPLAAPVALCGASGLAILLRYRRGSLFAAHEVKTETQTAALALPALAPKRSKSHIDTQAAIVLLVMTVLLVIPHLVGVVSVHGAEGYTSEVFHGENDVLQVAYPGYREAAIWLLDHTHQTGTVGLVALLETLDPGYYDVSWQTYNHDLTGRLRFVEAHPGDRSFPYDYLVWPMHLTQRGYTIPASWRSHIVHVVMGGNTTYCFVMARNLATIQQ
jgi:4-amino-4-deoxy-L-arabinose transferase-like glycosyltransferase